LICPWLCHDVVDTTLVVALLKFVGFRPFAQGGT
jgi:hypothetical protein